MIQDQIKYLCKTEEEFEEMFKEKEKPNYYASMNDKRMKIIS